MRAQRRPLLALAVVALAGRAASPVAAQPSPTPPAATAAMDARAREHLERGLRLYDAQKYAEAIAEFQAGYEIDAQPEFLYAMGQAERLNGDCRRAIAAFEAFLRTGPSAKREAS